MVSFALAFLLGGTASDSLAQSNRVAAAQPLWPGSPQPDSATAISVASQQVYRLLVESDGLVSGGTGFLVSGSRVIATNHHVIEKGHAFTAGFVDPGGAIRRVRLHLMAVFPQKDLALLEAEEDLPGRALPLSKAFPAIASELYAVGYPAAADLDRQIALTHTSDRNYFLPSVVRGNVSRVMAGHWVPHQLQHQTPISPGYSGGPLIDRQGMVIGISTAFMPGLNGIAYAVPSVDLVRLLTACALPLRSGDLLSRTSSRNFPDLSLHAFTSGQEREATRPSIMETQLLDRAEQVLRNGDVAGARMILEHVLRDNKLPEAYLALARTYDAAVLKRLQVIGTSADQDKAREYYDLAFGSRGETDTIPPTPCRNSLCLMLEQENLEPIVACAEATTSH